MAQNGGLHVGKPHTSTGDPKVHVTITHRDGQTGHITGKEHSSSLGSIAIGQAQYDAAQAKKNGN